MQIVQIINGINTDIGKTFACCDIIHRQIKNGKKINYIKPIISGFNLNNIEESDAGKALKAMGLEVNLKEISKITKYLLNHPTSPNIAAKLEGIEINYKDVLDFCIQSITSSKGDTIIEMSGGILTPITNSKTMLDLTKDITCKFNTKNILVVSNYLGAISHTLSANNVFNFDEIIWNIKQASPFDDEIIQTMEGFLGKKMVPLGGLEPPRA